LKYLKDDWGKPVVLRQEIKEFSNGIITTKNMALIDHRGQGPQRYKVNGKIAYDVDDFITWLEQKIERV
jgi:hypothetical protein